jgi:DNA-binding response OmpR family regulator
MIICFGDDYELDVERRELKRAQLPIHVEPQVFALLVYLVQNRDRVVSKDDVIEPRFGPAESCQTQPSPAASMPPGRQLATTVTIRN